MLRRLADWIAVGRNRRYLYRLGSASAYALAGFGVVSGERVLVLVALLGALLNIADRYVPAAE